MTMNGSLLGEYMKRKNNHEELLKGLKQLNNLIRCASNLRLGPPQQKLVAACRDAIKRNQPSRILGLMEKGV